MQTLQPCELLIHKEQRYTIMYLLTYDSKPITSLSLTQVPFQILSLEYQVFFEPFLSQQKIVRS